jgi:O2-independent ubiquinone biosynthesis accessory factor UbiT
MRPERLGLMQARGLIDAVDDGMVALLAARHRLVDLAGGLKRRLGAPVKDARREHRVHQRAARLSRHLGLPEESTRRLFDLVIGDACRQQSAGTTAGPPYLETSPMNLDMVPAPTTFARGTRWLRLLPPPQRLAPLLQAVPARWQARLLEAAMSRVLGAAADDGSLDFMRGRRIAIEVSDLRLRWVLEMREDGLRVVEDAPEASVRGSATDLLLLAGRLEDADTLFFQRALVMTGDTELGLTARNLLDRLPWESIPLGLRIVLNRGARLARDAREAYRSSRA